MNVINESKLALGDMHAAHVRHLMMAERDGKTIQRYTDGWHDIEEECNWYLDNVYRVKPNVKLQIPWEVIDEKWQWAAMDIDRLVFLSENKPTISKTYSDAWDWNGGDARRVDDILNVYSLPNACDWKYTLTKRPTCVTNFTDQYV